MISENLRIIEEKIRRAAAKADRDREEVRIVAAAKGQSVEKVKEAIAAGIRIIGHNYLQEAAENRDAVTLSDVQFHMIGHLQRNKANKAVDIFHVIETVDDDRLASALNRRCEAEGKIVGVMIQVNLSGEPQKSGISEDKVESLAEFIRALSSIRLTGLMTMPPFFDDPDAARPYFARLREVRDKLKSCGALTAEMNDLSMGMTGDYEVAVEEGATLVRIGTALFGPRG